jgi:hypothetical protein
MKTFMKYISLLLLCGLILPFYNSAVYRKSIAGRGLKLEKAKTEASKAAQKIKSISILKEIAGGLFPVLKNLN